MDITSYAIGLSVGKGSGYAKPCTDANEAIRPGVYDCADAANTPIKDGLLVVYAKSDTVIVQEYYVIATDNYSVVCATIRCLRGVDWSNWEWVNPLFSDSTEYLTTDRIDGKAVYKRRTIDGVIQYRIDGEETWNDYASVYGAAPTSHNQAASTVTAGTFAGQVVANSSGQTPETSLLRNSKLVTTDTNPTVNGEICWTYK